MHVACNTIHKWIHFLPCRRAWNLCLKLRVYLCLKFSLWRLFYPSDFKEKLGWYNKIIIFMPKFKIDEICFMILQLQYVYLILRISVLWRNREKTRIFGEKCVKIFMIDVFRFVLRIIDLKTSVMVLRFSSIHCY